MNSISTDIHELPLADLRPNNWYLSQEKLEAVRIAWREKRQDRLPPVLVAEIDSSLSLIDGHSRAFVALENGAKTIVAEVRPLADIGGPTELYRTIHRSGPAVGVTRLSDLRDRILPQDEYKREWIGYCRALASTSGRSP